MGNTFQIHQKAKIAIRSKMVQRANFFPKLRVLRLAGGPFQTIPIWYYEYHTV
jgi:hypothetical protein